MRQLLLGVAIALAAAAPATSEGAEFGRMIGVGYGPGYHAGLTSAGWGHGFGIADFGWRAPNTGCEGGYCGFGSNSCCDDVWAGYCNERKAHCRRHLGHGHCGHDRCGDACGHHHGGRRYGGVFTFGCGGGACCEPVSKGCGCGLGHIRGFFGFGHSAGCASCTDGGYDAHAEAYDSNIHQEVGPTPHEARDIDAPPQEQEEVMEEQAEEAIDSPPLPEFDDEIEVAPRAEEAL